VIAGVYLLGPGVATGVGSGMPLAMPDLIEAVMEVGRVVAFALPGPWLDIGTPDCYARAEQVVALTARALPRSPTSDVQVRTRQGPR
jgi:NDP-sugar pyrophosphorylase family protein